MAKYWISDLENKIVDVCLQLFGGYGYMNEYPIARMYRDSRVQRIYGGTNEIMKVLIAQDAVRKGGAGFARETKAFACEIFRFVFPPATP